MAASQLTGGFLFDIQGFSVHDGPGCRTLIFFKGCSLNCKWCSNPEGIHPFPEPLYNPEKCTLDLLCVKDCPENALWVVDHSVNINREVCRRCSSNACMDACCTGALRKAGYFTSVTELFRKIQRDRQYWGPRGGITVTGGEPFVQPGFVSSVLKKCYEAFIHTSAETCGNVPWVNLSESLKWLDWLFFDLKHIDTEMHKAATGTSNELILENARLLANEFQGRLIFRIPLIPAFNDDEKSLMGLAEFIKSTGKKEVNIIPVHHLGREKHKLLGRSYYTDDFRVPSKEALIAVSKPFTDAGLICYPGSETPF